MDGRKRSDIKPGDRVRVVQKHEQRSGRPADGTVHTILARSATNLHGIQVCLESGVVGGVKVIIPQREISKEKGIATHFHRCGRLPGETGGLPGGSSLQAERHSGGRGMDADPGQRRDNSEGA